MIEHWQQIFQSHWGINAKFVRLGGEFDLNFLATDATNKIYLFKVMRPDCPVELVQMQITALFHIKNTAPDLPVPLIIPALQSQSHVYCPDQNGNPRLCWVIEGLDGIEFAKFTPKTPKMSHALGRLTGALDQALADFVHPVLDRDFKWNLLNADWISPHLGKIAQGHRLSILNEILQDCIQIKPDLDSLPAQAIHNDINDYNILVDVNSNLEPTISGLIDFGDMCYAPRICELAIAGAYIVLEHPYPDRMLAQLVAGYHDAAPLSEHEIAMIWPLIRMRLAVSVVNSALMAQDNPDDPYVTISQAPAWRLLENTPWSGELVEKRLRHACGYPVNGSAERVLRWLNKNRGSFHSIIGHDLTAAPVIDLSPERSLNRKHQGNPLYFGLI